ncbi:hypothetical protein F4679DRAFT_276384 [Xylaria curta]|nr:hypothetical protein F4679DRAFT_276384 [Xylaria curta]
MEAMGNVPELTIVVDAGSELDTDLRKWLHQYVETDKRCQIHHKYSPEHDILWAKLWKCYDRLKGQQLQLHHPVHEWQIAVEEHRQELEEARRHDYQPIAGSLWSFCPLGAHLDRYAGNASPDREHSWKVTLQNWSMFRRLLRPQDPQPGVEREKTFEQSLSAPQKSSFEILDDWWHSRYAPSRLAESARRFMEARQELVDLHPLRSIKDESTKIDTSLYHSFCFQLFVEEFNPRCWEPNTSYVIARDLQQLRYDVSQYAITQKLAYASLFPESAPCRLEYPRLVSRNDTWRSDLEINELPSYLWDNLAHKTVEVASLHSRPVYTCISHTWGRWRVGTSVMVDGVPWLVPENSLYDVKQLPAMLHELPASYIWFDLFCIPQDGRKLQDIEISRQSTIFRNSRTCVAWIHDADSWTGLKLAIRWMSLRYFSVTAQLAEMSHHVLDDKMSQAWQEANVLAELVVPPRSSLFEEGDDGYDIWIRARADPVTWFSSLWTFQEALLCPDIEIYTRTWTRLEDGNGCPISLISLIVFTHLTRLFLLRQAPEQISIGDAYAFNLSFFKKHHADATYFSTRLPLGVSNLLRLIGITHLDMTLPNRSPASAFAGASTRICTSDRAPAIMSAIGVTNWFLQRLDRGWVARIQPHRLVLGSYPLEFVTEAFDKFGASFLNGKWSNQKFLHTKDLLRRKSSGSMMPFSSPRIGNKTNLAVVEGVLIEAIDHPSIATWKIRADGSIRVRFAGVLASTFEEGVPDVEAHLTYDNGAIQATRTRNIMGKLQDIGGVNPVFAVALFRDHTRQFGVLLQSPPATVFGRRYLVKIGEILVYGQTSTPSTKAVNWVIL